MKNLKMFKRLLVISICLCLFSGFNIAKAEIKKQDCPPVNCPVEASIELSQTRFLQPMVVKVKIKVKNITNNTVEVLLYNQDGKKITSIGENGKLSLIAGVEKSFSFDCKVDTKSLDLGYVPFIIKYPVILADEKKVYRNENLKTTVTRVRENDLVGVSYEQLVEPLVALPGTQAKVSFSFKNNGILKINNLTLTQNFDIGEANVNLGSLKPGETVAHNYSFEIGNDDIIGTALLEYKQYNEKTEKLVLPQTVIHSGEMMFKVTVK